MFSDHYPFRNKKKTKLERVKRTMSDLKLDFSYRIFNSQNYLIPFKEPINNISDKSLIFNHSVVK